MLRPRLQVPAQAGDAGAVADQDDGGFRRRGVEAAVGAHPHGCLVADLRVLRQPARGQTRRAVRPRHQANAELDPPVRRKRGDRVFAAGRLLAVADGQADLGDVARRPVGRVVDRFKREVVGLAAGAARVQQGPLDQTPTVIGGRGPVGRGGRAGDLVQLVLPVADGARVAIIHLDPVEQGLGAAVVQPVADRVAEAAIGVIGAVAQGQQAVGQVRQVRLGLHRLPHEAGGAVGGVALASRGGDDQQAPRAPQRLQIQVGERQGPRADAAVAQRPRRHPGQFLAKPGLAGEGDQHGVLARRLGQGPRLFGGLLRGRAHAPCRQADQAQPQGDGEGRPQPAGQVGGHDQASSSSIMAAKAGVMRSTRPRGVRSMKQAAICMASANSGPS